MTRVQLFSILTILISLAITHSYLWFRNIRPGRKNFRDYLRGEFLSQDEQTQNYIGVRTIVMVIALVFTASVLWLSVKAYEYLL